ncbi:MAG: hypothetical protein ACOC33_00135 [bacterium]
MTITFDKDKLFYTNLDNKIKEIKSEDLLMYLRADVEIKEGTTIANFMEHLRLNVDGINVIFGLSLGNADFNEYLKEYDTQTNEKLSWGEEGTWKLHHAEMSWAAEYVPNGEFKSIFSDSDDTSGWFELYASFGGAGETYDDWFGDGKKVWYPCGLSFSFTPLNQLKDVEIKLNKEIKIIKYPYEKHENGNYADLIGGVDHDMNLFTFIDAFLWEISFYGLPEDRNKVEDELMERMEEARNGESKDYISLDEFIEKLNDESKL